jgi:ribonuclease Z
MTKPRMGALWHMDVSPGADAAFAEIGQHYDGPVVATQDLTVFNVTAEAVVARQAHVNDAPHLVHGPSRSQPQVETMAAPPSWWTDAALEL